MESRQPIRIRYLPTTNPLRIIGERQVTIRFNVLLIGKSKQRPLEN